MKKQNNILLAQKYIFNKDLGEGNFYAVPNMIGRNVMVVKHDKKTSMLMPHAIMTKDKKEISVVVDNNFIKSEQNKKVSGSTVCFKVGRNKCRFEDLEQIVIELSEFFMDEVCFQGKVFYDLDRSIFKIYIYDVLTYSEYQNRKGETPYFDRRFILNMLYQHHSFKTVEIPIAFYYGNNILECDKLYDTMETIYNDLDGYLIYKENGTYIFGQTTSVLIKFKGDDI